MAVYYAKRLWGKSSSIYYLLLFYFSSALFYALIIPWSYRSPPSPSYALQCFANLKDLLVFWFTLLSSRIISPLFVKTTTTMTNAMSTFGGPPSSLLHGRRNPWAYGPPKCSYQKQRKNRSNLVLVCLPHTDYLPVRAWCAIREFFFCDFK